MKQPIPKSKRGFTLVEILCAATISLLMLGMAYPVFLLSVDSFGVNNSKLDVSADLRRFSQTLQRDCAFASTITLISTDKVDLLMPDGAKITYERLGGASAGLVRRTADGVSRTLIPSVAAAKDPDDASKRVFFVNRLGSDTLYVNGSVVAPAKSIRKRSVGSSFEIAATRRT